MSDVAVQRALELTRNLIGQYERFHRRCVNSDEVFALADYLWELGLIGDAEKLKRQHAKFVSVWTSLSDNIGKTPEQQLQSRKLQSWVADENITFLKWIIEHLETHHVPPQQNAGEKTRNYLQAGPPPLDWCQEPVRVKDLKEAMKAAGVGSINTLKEKCRNKTIFLVADGSGYTMFWPHISQRDAAQKRLASK